MSTLFISGKAIANGRGSGIGVQNSSMLLMCPAHPRLVAVSSKRCSLGCDTSDGLQPITTTHFPEIDTILLSVDFKFIQQHVRE